MLSGDHLTILGFLLLVLILSLRKLWGFLHLWYPEEKHYVHCLLCLIAVLVILSVKDPKHAAEYVGACSASCEEVWLRKLLFDLFYL